MTIITISKSGIPVEENDADIPVIDAYEDKRGVLVFWCAHCKTWHSHSLGEGHRVAHCYIGKSPYSDKGYILKRAGLLTPEIKRNKGKATPPSGDSATRIGGNLTDERNT